MSAEAGAEVAGERPVAAGGGRSITGVRGLIRNAHPADVAMGAAILVSGALLLFWHLRLTYVGDDWSFLLHRRSWSIDTFLDPFVRQLMALTTLIYKVLVSSFGIDSSAIQVVSVAPFLLSVVLLFVYVRARVGAWLAFALVLPILFLGASWENLLLPFQMAFTGSVACGIGALLALDRRDRLGNILATGLLILSLLFFNAGLPFVAGAAVVVAFDQERFSRAYVVALPMALWGLWYLGWGHEATTFFSEENFANIPSVVLAGFASGIGSLLGLAPPRGDFTTVALDWGRPLLVAALGLAGWRLYRLGRAPVGLLAVLAIGVGFWLLIAISNSPITPPTAGRYQYMGVIVIVLITAELARGVRLRGFAVVAAVFVAGAAALSNLSVLRNAADGLEGVSERERGGLAALELARDRVDPGFLLTPENSDVEYLGVLDAGSYLSAVDAYGSPAYTSEELHTAPEAARVAADKVFASALGVKLAPAPAGSAGGCQGVSLVAGPLSWTVPPKGLILRAGSAQTYVALRRYSSGLWPVALGPLPSGVPTLLEIPPDRSSEPWELQLTGSGSVSVCKRFGRMSAIIFPAQ